MKVIDFEINKFEHFVRNHFGQIIGSNQNVLIVAVAEGGIPVAELVRGIFIEQNSNPEILKIKAQRPSTKQKKSGKFSKTVLKTVFRFLPKFLLDKFRVWEHLYLSKNRIQERKIIQINELKSSQFDLVLIVDDAVDSGITMKKVIEFTREKLGNSPEIKTLAVVLTQKNPVYSPDFCMFQNVLIRFPWSLDGK